MRLPGLPHWIMKILGRKEPGRDRHSGLREEASKFRGPTTDREIAFHDGSGRSEPEYELWLWWETRSASPGSRRILRWLKAPMDRIQPLEPIAVLGDDAELMVLAPEGIRARLVTQLASDGAQVTSCQPLARIIAEDPGGLEPAAAYASSSIKDTTVIAKLMSRSRISKLAVIGALSLVGGAIAIVAMTAFMLWGGLAPPIIAAVAMALVTASLRLGEYWIEENSSELS